MLLFVAQIMLALGSPSLPMFDPDLFIPQDKWPDGGLGLTGRPLASVIL